MSTISTLLQRAEKYLDSAQVLHGIEDYESCVSRTYYAMFYAAEAVLLSKGITCSSHKGTISMFGEHFVRSGLLPAGLGRAINRAFDKRQIGDYGYSFKITAKDARELLAEGRSFVKATAKYLRKPAKS